MIVQHCYRLFGTIRYRASLDLSLELVVRMHDGLVQIPLVLVQQPVNARKPSHCILHKLHFRSFIVVIQYLA